MLHWFMIDISWLNIIIEVVFLYTLNVCRGVFFEPVNEAPVFAMEDVRDRLIMTSYKQPRAVSKP